MEFKFQTFKDVSVCVCVGRKVELLLGFFLKSKKVEKFSIKRNRAAVVCGGCASIDKERESVLERGLSREKGRT